MRPAFLLRAAALALAALLMAAPAAQAATTYYGVKANGAASPPRDRNSLLYYRIGGSESSQRAPNPGTVSVKLGLSGLGRVNFSCGKFDAQITVQNLLNNRLIDDLLFDARARREVVSQTAGTVIEAYRADQAASTAVAPAGRADPHPLSGGKAQ